MQIFIINYRNYKYFNNDSFRNELMYELSRHRFRDMDCENFEIIFLAILNKHATLKKTYIRANNSPFMNKSLSKAIMVRFNLRNKYIRFKNIETHEVLRKTKKDFYENLNSSLITYNETFWKQVKPFPQTLTDIYPFSKVMKFSLILLNMYMWSMLPIQKIL